MSCGEHRDPSIAPDHDLTQPVDDRRVEAGALVALELLARVFGREPASQRVELVLSEIDVAFGHREYPGSERDGLAAQALWKALPIESLEAVTQSVEGGDRKRDRLEKPHGCGVDATREVSFRGIAERVERRHVRPSRGPDIV